MEQSVKKIKRKDYRIDCFRKALLGVKKAHLFRMQKAVRNLRKVRKISEKPLPEELEQEEREKKTLEISKTIQKFERQIKRLDSISKKDMRIVALYILKKEFEISFEKEKAFFEKAAPGFEELLEQMEKESGENLDNKWFYSLILTTKPVKQAFDAVRDVLEKVDKVKGRSKNKRKTKKVRAIERKRLKELGIEEDETQNVQGLDYRIEEDGENMSYSDSLDELVSIDYGSDAEMDFEDKFDEINDKEEFKPSNQSQTEANHSNDNDQTLENTRETHYNERPKNSTKQSNSLSQQKQLPTFKQKIHASREKKVSDQRGNKDQQEYSSKRVQRQNEQSNGSRAFNRKDFQKNDKNRPLRSNNFEKFASNNDSNSPRKGFNSQEHKSKEKKLDFRPVPANYHPSWQARVEQRQTEYIAPFQGKKIKL